MLSGPAGQQPGRRREQGSPQGPRPHPTIKFIGEPPFEVTNWDPALTQKVVSAAIAKYPKIDVIMSDFGPSLVGALPEFTRGPQDPRSRGRGRERARVLLEEELKRTRLQAVHGLDAERPRPARDRLGRGASDGRQEAEVHALPVARVRGLDTGKPNGECEPKLPGDISSPPSCRLPLRRSSEGITGAGRVRRTRSPHPPG